MPAKIHRRRTLQCTPIVRDFCGFPGNDNPLHIPLLRCIDFQCVMIYFIFSVVIMSIATFQYVKG